MAFLFRENRRHGMDGQRDGQPNGQAPQRMGWKRPLKKVV